MPLKIIESRKGISPILVTLLLTVIAVAVLAVTCDWFIAGPRITASEEGKQIHMSNVNFADSPNMRIGISVNLQPGLRLWQ